MLLRYGYVVFIGILLALFIGVGIAAFYPGPQTPEYSYPQPKELTATDSATTRQEDLKQQAEWKQFQVKSEDYNKNVAMIAIVFSLLALVTSLLFAKYISLLADGVLLGSVFTLIYAIIRSFGTQDFKFMFIVISVGLAIALFLGYRKFIK